MDNNSVLDNAPARAVLVGVDWETPGGVNEASLDELADLAATAGAEVAGRLTQRRRKPDPAYCIGYGKARELAAQVQSLQADLIIFDEELTPVQTRNLESAAQARVVDRAGLILDIFAQRARTREAQLQVELAQLEYLLPRLGGRGTQLSRLGGGIGTRGPGETKLESDRRRIRQRIASIRRALGEVRAQRSLMRRPRQRSGVATIALIGYTNAGKSTLFNALTAGGAFAENKLFATLDPTLRRMDLPGGGYAVLADTVGFIRKLPPQLIEAFRATLEEVVQADLLLHVLEAGVPDLPSRAAAVHAVLAELGIGDWPSLTVLNKIDLLDPASQAAARREFPEALPISAAKGWGLDGLRKAVAESLAVRRRIHRLLLPFDAAGILHRLHERGAVLSEEYRPEGVEIQAELDPADVERLRRFRI